MDVAIIGATGSCGRQLATQLLEGLVLPASAKLQLVGHHGGSSEHESWGLRADLEDAFEDVAPSIELVLDAGDIDADVVVMLAGNTISNDPGASMDRAKLGLDNYRIFETYAAALAQRDGPPPMVIVQSNPVELGVQVFAARLGRTRVLGAGGWSDTLRLRAEIAVELGVRRPQVHIPMLGQHGDNMVPAWSQLQVRGVDRDTLAAFVRGIRAGRSLHDLPDEIRAAKAHMLETVRDGQVGEAYDYVGTLTPDVRAAVKPFFTHFTSGHTTEIVTARAVADIVAALARGQERVMPVQVELRGEWLGIEGVIGAPVVLGPSGWEHPYALDLADDEIEAVTAAARAIKASNASVAGSA